MKLHRIARFSALLAALPFRARRQHAGCGRRQAGFLAVVLLAITGLAAQAQGNPTTAAALFKDADLALGSKLIQEHRCVACHVRQVGGDGSAIYRPKGRINNPGLLRGMVEQCNTEMNLGLFPDEVTSVAAVLNRDHYRFK